MLDAEGPSERRELNDADMPETEGAPGERALVGEDGLPDAATAAEAEQLDHRSSEALVDDIVHEKVEQAELTPWALSVHLEQRIEKVNEMSEIAKAQIEALEASSRKLEKRLSSL